MIKIIYSFLFSFLTIISYGQLQQQNIWLFGPGTKGIVFDATTNEPTVITGKYSPYGSEGCSVATNPSTGELLFYSDGIRVVDADNQVMPNGSGLFGNSSSAQNAWVCGVPGNCNQYYLFSSAGEKSSNPSGPLYYSIIDVTLPGNGTPANPKGDIVTGQKSILINAVGSEALTIIKSTNFGEYWLLNVGYNTKVIRIYKITATGIQLFNTYTGTVTYKDPRNIRYSEKVKKFCITSLYTSDPVTIGDFDPSTGTISSLNTVPGTPFTNTNIDYFGCYDSEWSPDGTKLYIGLYRNYSPSTGGKLYQYDFLNPTADPVLLYNVNGTISNPLTALKIGPDNKLYVGYSSPVNGSRYIGRVENPNAEASLIIFTPNAVDMGVGFPNYAKFPEFMAFDNHAPIANDDDQTAICTSQPIDINVLSNDTDPDNHTLSATVIKTYKGTSTLNGDGSINYVPLMGYQGNDTIWYKACDNACVSLCDTAYVLICNPRICSNSAPIPVVDVVPCFYNSLTTIIDVLKNDSDPDQDSIYISSVQVTQGIATIYRDTLIQYIPAPGFSGTVSMTYTVCDTSTCNTNNCTQISFDLCIQTPVCVNRTPVVVDDAFNCMYDTTSYIWLDVLQNDSDPDSDLLHIASVNNTMHGIVSIVGNTVLQYEPKLGFSGKDTITYIICDDASCPNSCVQTKTTVCIETLPINIPNLFTPNGDAHNETFFIEGLYPNTKVSIYNRWGDLVYETINYDNTWGRSEKITDGLYYYQIVDATRGKTYKSWLQVLGKK